MGGGHGEGTTYKGLTMHPPKRWHVVTGKGLCAMMWVGDILGRAMVTMGMTSIRYPEEVRESTRTLSVHRMRHRPKLTVMDMKVMEKIERYLGNPLFFTRSKKKDFCFLRDKGYSIDIWKHPWIPWVKQNELSAALNPPRAGVPRPLIKPESALHLFKNCVIAKMIGFDTPSPIRTACILDLIWKTQNNLLFRPVLVDPARIQLEFYTTFSEMRTCKLASDYAGLAAIFKDSEGSILRVAYKHDMALNALHAELKGIHLARVSAKEQRWNKELSLRIKTLCAYFSNVSFNIVSRAKNALAYSLARWTRINGGSLQDIDSYQ
ncbi:hypothetical protein PanWU01x14_151920 [Parasponia andersonii]|uniref:Uncharacterized protein n=1 Tax=Parasponia andersonii TaxID=3476 RepID=A0A2P5CHP8_PARAD|nr:hypothetical protein PanWU01x14_151920 [Parasponia andersonii]